MRLRFEPMTSFGLADELRGVRRGKFSFVVSRDGAAWSASWANHDPATFPLGGRRLTTQIGDVGGYASQEAAEAACEAMFDQLRQPA